MIEVIANEYQQEELVALLDEYSAAGFEQTGEKLIAYFGEDNFAHKDVLKTLGGYAYQISAVKEQNWNTVWEQNFYPVVVNDFCAIRAHFHQPITTVEHEIIITPKMSFGTGHHATTYMMMEQMRNIDFKNKNVFDFGTGTGILAILAHKLGAAKVSAIDLDEWSISNARENFERNDCSQINIELSNRPPSQQFDIILANINRNVILHYMSGLRKALKPQGQLLLSGLLIADETDIVAKSSSYNLQFQNKWKRDGWISLLFASPE
ncbi:MAG: 50S ribosomal protein L11 methyltransferase [Bacteroidota bacterium]|nr:50S ribosomal protein L11 methyltransferase [Bacteroidota bacterium]